MLVVVGVTIQFRRAQYTLSPTETKLLGSSSVAGSLIKEDETSYSYKRTDEQKQTGKSVVMAASTSDSTGRFPYETTLPKDSAQGITFGDSEGKLRFNLKPNFKTSTGQRQGGRIVYPDGLNQTHVYTLKRNGIKEDIVLAKAPGDIYKKTWSLEFDDQLEAKSMPDGSIGLYSANPYLFGKLEIGDEKSRQLVENAKKNGQKTNLAFVMPRPFTIDGTGHKNYSDVSYSLKGKELTLEAKNLKSKSYPLSIDPSIIVTTASDFQKGNDDGMIDYAVPNQINRSDVSLGSVGATTQQTSAFTGIRYGHTSAVYNGYLYVVGGLNSGTSLNDISYCPINTNGSIGTCTQQSNAFTSIRYSHASIAYNGYLYIIGGTDGTSFFGDIQYCPIAGDGSVGGCTQQNSAFTIARYNHTSVVNNGYLYIIGGTDGSAPFENDIQYCPINADGSVGTCTRQTNAFTTARQNHSTVIYNNFLYIIGGADNSSAALNDIIYCPINANGSVGVCTQQAAAFTGARFAHTSVVSNGHLYIIGGIDASNFGDIQYCPINANGSVGVCTQQNSAYTTTRSNHTSIVSNGYVYIVGGSNGGGVGLNDIQYLRIEMNGMAGATTTNGTGFTSAAREGHSSVVYNNYFYVIGGYTGTYQNNIERCPINANGSVGGCTNQAAIFTTARAYHSSIVHNDKLYIIGGTNGTRQNDIIRCTISASTGAVSACTQQTNAFTTARESHTSVTYNNYLYIIGGTSGTNQNDIQYCLIAAAGSVGACTQQSGAFTTARNGHTSIVSNGNLYIIGGYNGTTYENDIQYCPISLSGSVSACTQQTSAFTSARGYHTSVVNNTYLYIVGGYDGTNYFNDIQSCRINANGSVDPCTQQLSAFTTARRFHSSIVNNGFAYIIGGTDGTRRNDIQYALLKYTHDGRVGTSTRQTTMFLPIREFHSTVVHNGYLYIVGGDQNPTNHDDIHHCPINDNGSIGTCIQQDNIFTTARRFHRSVVNKGYLYIIGGNSGSGHLNDIIRCPFNADGSVGTCLQQTNAFTTARSYPTTVVYNNTLYIIGGTNGTVQNDIQRCPLTNSNGSVGTCQQQTNAFTTARESHTSEINNGYIYIIGGWDGATYLNDIQYCPINADTTVGTCIRKPGGFVTARYDHSSVVADNRLYIIGGYSGVFHNDVQYCPLNANGSVDPCIRVNSAFTTARNAHASVFTNGHFYIIGGWSGSVQLNDIIRVPINSPPFGSVGSTAHQTSAFTTARSNHASVVHNGYLYITGGFAGSYQNDIQYCPLSANGSVGTCTQQSGAFTTARSAHTSVVHNNYLYIIGGTNGTSQNDIQYCPLNANGSIGSCTQQSGAFTTARSAHTSVVNNGYLYIVGGTDGSSYYNDIQYCPLNANGSIGSCTQQSGAFTSTRANHTSVAYNGYLYIIGGFNGTIFYQHDIQYCPLNGNGSVGTCNIQANAFTSARAYHASIINNGQLYLIGGNWSGGDLNDIQHCPLNTNGSIGDCVQQTNAFNIARNGHASVASNGYLYIIGGADANRRNDIQYLPIDGPNHSAFYERTIDVGQVSTLNNLVVNGTLACAADLYYRTAGTNGVFGSTTKLTSAQAGATYVISIVDQRYITLKLALDDTQCGGRSQVTDITVNYIIPSVPALVSPSSNAIGVALLPQFQLRSSDALSDYLRYKIEVCSNSDCSTILRTIDQTASQTGWSGQDTQSNTAYVSNPVITSSTIATHTYQTAALSLNTQYWWRAYSIDPGNGNVFSQPSTIQTFTTQNYPSVPTLIEPTGSVGTISPVFKLRSSDADNDYLRYKIDVCSNSDCSTILRTIDQTSSQTGWSGQDATGGTAFGSNANLSASTVAFHYYQSPHLDPNTQYWWRAYAIDPAGMNAFTAASSINTFTTSAQEVQIRGGTDILGGTEL